MLDPLRASWTYRPIDFASSVVERRVAGVLLALEVLDGGGYVRTLGVWRVAGDAVAIIEAGEA